jgi:hypothetical protein
MSVFDFDRFNGFMRQSLDDLLFNDLWNHDIFNESDLHSAAYFYIRTYFEKNERSNIYVRCEPQLAGMKPDIVIYDRAKPIYGVEFKFFTKPDFINEEAVFKDLDKLAEIVSRFDSMKWGFFYLVHDGEESYTFSNPSLRRRGYEKISFSTVNLRRKEENGRRRNNYDEWRAEFDKLVSLHREHAQ